MKTDQNLIKNKTNKKKTIAKHLKQHIHLKGLFKINVQCILTD